MTLFPYTALFRSVCRLVKQQNCDLTACENGHLAFDTVKTSDTHFNFGIIDYNMPDMNGLEVISSIRNYEKENIDIKAMRILCTFLYNE